jgi:cob(I)alamin adenosyltransferase
LERRLVELADNEAMRAFPVEYINRLSDWCFVLSRWLTTRLGGEEVLWQPIGERSSGEAERARLLSDHDDIGDVVNQT